MACSIRLDVSDDQFEEPGYHQRIVRINLLTTSLNSTEHGLMSYDKYIASWKGLEPRITPIYWLGRVLKKTASALCSVWVESFTTTPTHIHTF